MAAQDYYNSFNQGNATPAPSQAPSYHSSAPPPYQQFPQGPAPISPVQQYSPPQEYGWKPGQQHVENYDQPRPQVSHQPHQQQYYPSQPPPQPQRPEQRPPPQPPRPAISTQHLSVPNVRPHRSHSEPPSPIYDSSGRRHERIQPHSRHDREDSRDRHSRHHSHGRRRHSRSRSRSRDRRPRREKEHTSSRDGDRTREKARDSKTKPTFIGALGGSVIGDLIFPGLGTVGGALLGGVGGYEAGRKRGGSERPRRRRKTYEEEWDEGRRRRGEI